MTHLPMMPPPRAWSADAAGVFGPVPPRGFPAPGGRAVPEQAEAAPMPTAMHPGGEIRDEWW